MTDLPRLARVEQALDTATLPDPRRTVHEALGPRLATLPPAARIAVAVGSRGLGALPELVAGVCEAVRAAGGEPFVVPAMGSHGGATSEGQRALLAGFGITEDIVSDVTPVELGWSPEGFPLLAARPFAEADGIVILNRVKPHTKFKGRIESGILKMAAVGLGGPASADSLHRLAVAHGMEAVIRSVGTGLAATLPVLAGVAVVENALGQPREVRALASQELEADEMELLELAKTILPRIPVPEVDLLIVDAIGKDVSGTGMDTNVIGRNRDLLGAFETDFLARRIYVRGLTPGTHGNAHGMGLADFVHERLARDIDWETTRANALTASSPEKAALPLAFGSDREALVRGLASAGVIEASAARIVRIASTKELRRLWVSEPLLSALPGEARVLGEPAAMVFDEAGNLAE
jgi:hypothetical protein